MSPMVRVQVSFSVTVADIACAQKRNISFIFTLARLRFLSGRFVRHCATWVLRLLK